MKKRFLALMLSLAMAAGPIAVQAEEEVIIDSLSEETVQDDAVVQEEVFVQEADDEQEYEGEIEDFPVIEWEEPEITDRGEEPGQPDDILGENILPVTEGSEEDTAESEEEDLFFEDQAETLEANGYPESSHPYADNMDRTWTYFASDYRANMYITFSSDTETESGYDYIYIYENYIVDDNFLIGKYTGTELAGKTILVESGEVCIRLTSDSSVNKYGFSIDRIMEITPNKGYCGDNVQYEVKDGTLRIYGSGKMYDYRCRCDGSNGDAPPPWDNYAITSVVIEEGVTGVGKSAFSNMLYLRSVTLPDSLTTIRTCAFHGCQRLQKIIIPDRVSSIGNKAFYDCSNLKYVFCESVEGKYSFGYDAFYTGNSSYYGSLPYVHFGCRNHMYESNYMVWEPDYANPGVIAERGCPVCRYYTGNTTSIPKKVLETVELSGLEYTEYGPKLSWEDISDRFDGYYVYRKETTGAAWTRITSTDESYYYDSSAALGKKYYYTVRAWRRCISNREEVWLGAEPKYVTVTGGYDKDGLSIDYSKRMVIKSIGNTASGVKITWDTQSGVEGYNVYRKTSTTSWKKISTITDSRVNTFIDGTSLTNGTEYSYAVRAVAGSYESKFTAASILYLSCPVYNSCISRVIGKISLDWQPNSAASGYEVKLVDGGISRVFNRGTSTTYTISNLEGLKTYKVYVRAYAVRNGVKCYSGWSGKSVKVKTIDGPTISAKYTDSETIYASWNKISNADGYETRIVSDYNDDIYKLNNPDTLSRRFRYLYSGETYKVYVRSFATINNIKYYSAWSGKTIKLPQPVLTIILDPSSLTLEAGKGKYIYSFVGPTSATNQKVSWSSSNTSVATVSSSGYVTAKSPGTAVITCKALDGSGVYAECKVTVKRSTATPAGGKTIRLADMSMSYPQGKWASMPYQSIINMYGTPQSETAPYVHPYHGGWGSFTMHYDNVYMYGYKGSVDISMSYDTTRTTKYSSICSSIVWKNTYSSETSALRTYVNNAISRDNINVQLSTVGGCLTVTAGYSG